MKTLSDFNFKNKTVILRSDLNSDVVNGKVLLGERIEKSAITIKELKRKKAKIVILAHQGKPGKSDFIPLKQHARLLNRFVPVRFLPDFLNPRTEKNIENLKSGEVLLLDNIRQSKDEFDPIKKNNEILKRLVPLADAYVNDSFSVCHRKHTSIVGFPKKLPSFAGRLLEKEVGALKKIHIKKNLFILGGAKPEDDIKLLGKGNKVLVCGLFGQACLISKGHDLGAQNKYLKKEKVINNEILKKLKRKVGKNIITPVDFAVKVDGKRKEIPLEDFPSKYEIFDIGKKTQEIFKKEIKKAKAIYMKGPAGFCADKSFCQGTQELLKEISKNKGFSLLGGGHLIEAIDNSKINKKRFNHISLSGGALLRHVAGEKLPGLALLEKRGKK